MEEIIKIWSVDPGIKNTGQALVCFYRMLDENGACQPKSSKKNKYSDLKVFVKKTKNSTLLERDPISNVKETPGLLLKDSSVYMSKLTVRLQKDAEFLDFIDECTDLDNAVLLVEYNKNKYTKDIAPIVVCMANTLVKHRIPVYTVNPLGVFSSMKTALGWKKGEKWTRAHKKTMTRKYIKRILPDLAEQSDDVNDAILNTLYWIKKNKIV